MLDVDGLVVSHDGGLSRSVDGVSFRVGPGERLVLLGASGCGKTTTLKAINRLVEPLAGTIRFSGRDTSEVDPVGLRRRIGYVIQEVGLFPHWTVARNVGVVPRLLGWDAARVEARVRELLELVQLSPAEFAERKPSELSGGQRQRVGFARALAGEPPLMLLDEPFGALDPLTREDLGLEFRELQDRLGFATVLVTHDMSEALAFADRIVVMRAGRIVQAGAPAELLAAPADDYVERLLATPRRQAERLARLAGERP